MPRHDPEGIVQLVGARVRELRMKQGLTQSALALRINATNQRIQKVERGRENLTLFSLVALANALDVSICELFEPVRHRLRPRAPGRPRALPIAAERAGRRKRR